MEIRGLISTTKACFQSAIALTEADPVYICRPIQGREGVCRYVAVRDEMQVHMEEMRDGVTIKELTIRRDLDQIAMKVSWGVYEVPGKPQSSPDSATATPVTE